MIICCICERSSGNFQAGSHLYHGSLGFQVAEIALKLRFKALFSFGSCVLSILRATRQTTPKPLCRWYRRERGLRSRHPELAHGGSTGIYYTYAIVLETYLRSNAECRIFEY